MTKGNSGFKKYPQKSTQGSTEETREGRPKPMMLLLLLGRGTKTDRPTDHQEISPRGLRLRHAVLCVFILLSSRQECLRKGGKKTNDLRNST